MYDICTVIDYSTSPTITHRVPISNSKLCGYEVHVIMSNEEVIYEVILCKIHSVQETFSEYETDLSTWRHNGLSIEIQCVSCLTFFVELWPQRAEKKGVSPTGCYHVHLQVSVRMRHSTRRLGHLNGYELSFNYTVHVCGWRAMTRDEVSDKFFIRCLVAIYFSSY